MFRHRLALIAENTPGILARITALITRRRFSIDSLSAQVTENANIVHVTVTVKTDHPSLRRLVRQLDALVDVLLITETSLVQNELDSAQPISPVIPTSAVDALISADPVLAASSSS